MAIDWTERGEYIAKHKITPAQANEALADPDAVIFDPDYNTRSGEGVRTIGYSPNKGAVLTVITVEENGVVHDSSAWKFNGRDRRYYYQGGPK